jgi:MFS family permease
LFRAIQGAGAYSSILQAMIGDHFRKDNKHGKGMSLFSVSMTCGYFGGIIIGGYISTFLGFRMIFLFSTLLGIISVFLFITLVKEPNRPNNSRMNNNNEKSKSTLVKMDELQILLKDREFLAIVALNSLRWFLFSGIYVLFIWQIQINFGLSQINATYYIMILVFIYMVFILLGGFLADHHGIKKNLIYSQILIISIGLIVFISTTLMVFFIVGIFIGIGFALFMTSGYAILSKTIDENHPELKGSAFGFNNTIGFLLGAFGPIFICFLGELSDFLPYYLISIIISITLVITIKFIKVNEAPAAKTNDSM